jgi:uncharacterized protein YutD
LIDHYSLIVGDVGKDGLRMRGKRSLKGIG